MKVFISWSGDRSRMLANSLHGWLTFVINAVEPWMSSNDINPGTRWGAELAGELEKTRYGIICVTADNMNAPWLLFESGALSKQVEKARVVPLLLGIKPSDIEGPLAQFQSIQANEEGMQKLLAGINLTVFEGKERGLDEIMLNEAFNLWWPKLNESIKNIPSVLIPHGKEEERSERAIMEETLILVRDIKRRVGIITTPKKSAPIDEMPPPPDNFPAGWDSEWLSDNEAFKAQNALAFEKEDYVKQTLTKLYESKKK